MRAHLCVLLWASFERELKRKAERKRFKGKRRLKPFNDWLTQISEGKSVANG